MSNGPEKKGQRPKKYRKARRNEKEKRRCRTWSILAYQMHEQMGKNVHGIGYHHINQNKECDTRKSGSQAGTHLSLRQNLCNCNCNARLLGNHQNLHPYDRRSLWLSGFERWGVHRSEVERELALQDCAQTRSTFSAPVCRAALTCAHLKRAEKALLLPSRGASIAM